MTKFLERERERNCAKCFRERMLIQTKKKSDLFEEEEKKKKGLQEEEEHTHRNTHSLSLTRFWKFNFFMWILDGWILFWVLSDGGLGGSLLDGCDS